MKKITDEMLRTRTAHTGIRIAYANGGVKLTYKGENLTGYGTRREAMNVIEAIEKYIMLDMVDGEVMQNEN